MACGTLTQSIPFDCSSRSGVGGIRSIFVAPFDQINTLTTSGGTATAFTLSGSNNLYRYDFMRYTGSFSQNYAPADNGQISYAPEITLQFIKQEVNKRNEIELLAQVDVVVVVLDNNGTYWLVGTVNGLTLTALNAVTGTAKADLNGYTLTLSGGEPSLAYQIAGSIVLGLLEA